MSESKEPDCVYNPEEQRADTQQLLVIKEEVSPEPLGRSSSLDPPEPPTIKEEELWTNQEGGGLHELEEANVDMSIEVPVTVKSEEEEEELQLPKLHETPTEENKETECGKTEREDCEGSEPNGHLEPITKEDPSLSGSETDDSCDWETSGAQSASNSLQSKNIPVSNGKQNPGKTLDNSSECAVSSKGLEKQQEGIQKDEKPFGCSVCEKRFKLKSSLYNHQLVHSAEKPFRCSVCNSGFFRKSNLVGHMRLHTGEKPFSCSICDKGYTLKSSLTSHQKTHSGEKPFRCSLCGQNFLSKYNFYRHQQVHTGEKYFSCSVCGKTFTQKTGLYRHHQLHMGGQQFACSVCGKSYILQTSPNQNQQVHTGGKPYSCSVCNSERFYQKNI